MSKALEDIAAERQRQIAKEGYDATHDDFHGAGELASAAAAYALADDFPHKAVEIWPWTDEWKPGDRRRNMVKAGALILAEIEQLDRMTANAKPQT